MLDWLLDLLTMLVPTRMGHSRAGFVIAVAFVSACVTSIFFEDDPRRIRLSFWAFIAGLIVAFLIDVSIEHYQRRDR